MKIRTFDFLVNNSHFIQIELCSYLPLRYYLIFTLSILFSNIRYSKYMLDVNTYHPKKKKKQLDPILSICQKQNKDPYKLQKATSKIWYNL